MEQTGYSAIVSVSQVNEYIKALIDSNEPLNEILIRGEISNFKNHYASGHLYFSLKDEGSVLRCIMFRFHATSLRFQPEEGMQVIAHGKISVYAKDGSYSLNVDYLQPDGVGSLAIAFEQLKNRLSQEGLFDESRKKSLPKYPKTVGVITSSTGAAVRDIINISKRRFSLAKILIYPALVQGVEAPRDLIRALNYLNDHRLCDVIIIGRGGGSMEDLWCFNDEGLARAISRSVIPVVSAVGHETDFTICDFVADVRAPTPSAAAEIVLPDYLELKRTLRLQLSRQEKIIDSIIKNNRQKILRLSSSTYLKKQSNYIDEKRVCFDHLSEKFIDVMNRLITLRRNGLVLSSKQLDALSPLAVLGRGYSIVYNSDDTVVSSISSLKSKDEVTLFMKDGQAKVVVKDINAKN